MNELPKDLAGWQCLADDTVIAVGDLAVRDGEPQYIVKIPPYAATSESYKRLVGATIYRKLAVAKQGDLDHKNFAQKESMPTLPTTPSERKKIPICTGVLDYFPDAIAAVAECSWAGNQQHHAGTPLHWDKTKSTDEPDALVRHLIQRGTRDTDGIRHSAKTAWRALALLQREIEAEGIVIATTPVHPEYGVSVMVKKERAEPESPAPRK